MVPCPRWRFSLPLSSLTLEKPAAMSEGRPGSRQRGIKACQPVCESSWKQVFGGQLTATWVTLEAGPPWPSLRTSTALTGSLAATSRETLSQNYQLSHFQIPDLQKLRDTKFGVICYPAVDNYDRWIPWNLSFSDDNLCVSFLLPLTKFSWSYEAGKITEFRAD